MCSQECLLLSSRGTPESLARLRVPVLSCCRSPAATSTSVVNFYLFVVSSWTVSTALLAFCTAHAVSLGTLRNFRAWSSPVLALPSRDRPSSLPRQPGLLPSCPFPSGIESIGPRLHHIPRRRAPLQEQSDNMSQVKNLRAMFENKGDDPSPPERGRSPAGFASGMTNAAHECAYCHDTCHLHCLIRPFPPLPVLHSTSKRHGHSTVCSWHPCFPSSLPLN